MSNTAEWLEPDGLGGFASGCVDTIRRRRYHGLLLAATTPPTGRRMLVSGVEVWLEGDGAVEALSSHRYEPAVVHPDGRGRIRAFSRAPWPTWTYQLSGGAELRAEIIVARGHARVMLRWTLFGGDGSRRLFLRPLLADRDYHALTRENGAASGSTARRGHALVWRLYAGGTDICCVANGEWRDDPRWYRQFVYDDERERGLDAVEDLLSPGVLSFDVSHETAVCVFATEEGARDVASPDAVAAWSESLAEHERRRRAALGDVRDQSADAYLVRRGQGTTLIAGYPWFTDWGRDTFIAMRGLCLATGRLGDARDILLEWSGAISEGMLPNRFPDAGEAPEYNSVDAALWFAVVAHELISSPRAAQVLSPLQTTQLHDAVTAILEGYHRGTRYGIRCDRDGLLAAGAPGLQLTWMDARVGDREITPRIGKPVEIQALWINALEAGAAVDPSWRTAAGRARAAFDDRFWNPEAGCLFDVIDADHQPGAVNAQVRPNQLLAVGGLPFALCSGERARAVVALAESRLWTPLGLRSLAPDDPAYAGRYEGGPSSRDAVYHQGTAWPWLAGPFVDAWVRVRGGSAAVQREARQRFLSPLLAYLAGDGMGHLPEIADGDAPHTARGCPFQAWSLGETIRLDRSLAK